MLDPGAGLGMLSAAVCERVIPLTKPRQLEIHAYETDLTLLSSLETTLLECRDRLADYGHKLEYYIHPTDFILDGPCVYDPNGLFVINAEANFDAVVMNPPYKKIGKSSDYAQAMMNSIVCGQPNLYTSFMSLGASVLKPGGQFVAISPRSFANGPYFRSFRRNL